MISRTLCFLLSIFLLNFSFSHNPSMAETLPELPPLSDTIKSLFMNAESYSDNTERMKYVEVETTDGYPAFLVHDREKLTILNYGAAWCAACIIEIPSLKRMQLAHPNLKIMYISDARGGTAPFREMVERLGMPADLTFFDSRGFVKRWAKIRAVPTTFVINASGEILYRFEGEADWTSPEIESFIQSLEAYSKKQQK